MCFILKVKNKVSVAEELSLVYIMTILLKFVINLLGVNYVFVNYDATPE